MQNTTERRQQILEYISDRRHVTMQEIVDEFQISMSTAKRDIQVLACSYPLITENWRGGGIRAMDGWYFGRRYLRPEQEALLRDLLPGLQPEQQRLMQGILTSFAKPSKEAHR